MGIVGLTDQVKKGFPRLGILRKGGKKTQKIFPVYRNNLPLIEDGFSISSVSAFTMVPAYALPFSSKGVHCPACGAAIPNRWIPSRKCCISRSCVRAVRHASRPAPKRRYPQQLMPSITIERDVSTAVHAPASACTKRGFYPVDR